tara:strand:+ start:77 stop:487 length:411 start_codon:yes stop_codon:yes gene_type:complete
MRLPASQTVHANSELLEKFWTPENQEAAAILAESVFELEHKHNQQRCQQRHRSLVSATLPKPNGSSCMALNMSKKRLNLRHVQAEVDSEEEVGLLANRNQILCMTHLRAHGYLESSPSHSHGQPGLDQEHKRIPWD